MLISDAVIDMRISILEKFLVKGYHLACECCCSWTIRPPGCFDEWPQRIIHISWLQNNFARSNCMSQPHPILLQRCIFDKIHSFSRFFSGFLWCLKGVGSMFLSNCRRSWEPWSGAFPDNKTKCAAHEVASVHNNGDLRLSKP